jgi:hypothetical protein
MMIVKMLFDPRQIKKKVRISSAVERIDITAASVASTPQSWTAAQKRSELTTELETVVAPEAFPNKWITCSHGLN